jgi:transcriptional regulator with XRE-family HTH domain
MPTKTARKKKAPSPAPARRKSVAAIRPKAAPVPKAAAAPRDALPIKPPSPPAAAAPQKATSPLVENLLTLMKARGLTARGLSLKAGLSQDTVRNVLQARSQRPRAGAVIQLAGALQVSAEALTGLEPLPSGPPGQPQPTASVPEVVFSVLRQPGEPATVERRAARPWQIPRSLLEARGLGDASLIVTAALDDCGEVRRGDRVLLDAGDATPSPPGVYLVFDGFGLGLARCSIAVRDGKPLVRAERLGVEAAEVPVADFKTEGRILGRWQWL